MPAIVAPGPWRRPGRLPRTAVARAEPNPAAAGGHRLDRRLRSWPCRAPGQERRLEQGGSGRKNLKPDGSLAMAEKQAWALRTIILDTHSSGATMKHPWTGR